MIAIRFNKACFWQGNAPEGDSERMNIPKRYYGPLVVLSIAVVVTALGAFTTIVINPSTVTVKIPDKNLAVDILPTGTTCPGYGAPVYNHNNNGTISFDWGTITEPGSTSFLFCLENAGTATSVVFAQGTVTPSPSPGSLTIAPAGVVFVAAQAITPIPVTLTVTIGVPATTLGITYSFRLTIG